MIIIKNNIRVSSVANLSYISFLEMDLEVVVVHGLQGGGLLVLGDAAFEKVLLLLHVDGFGEPGEGIGDAGVENGQAAALQAI